MDFEEPTHKRKVFAQQDPLIVLGKAELPHKSFEQTVLKQFVKALKGLMSLKTSQWFFISGLQVIDHLSKDLNDQPCFFLLLVKSGGITIHIIIAVLIMS